MIYGTYFTSIPVSKDGMEVVISNQEKSRNKILRLLTEESVFGALRKTQLLLRPSSKVWKMRSHQKPRLHQMARE